VGRFITKDSLFGLLLHPVTLNRYLFVLNNPIKYVDVWGNESKNSNDDNSNSVNPGVIGPGFYPFNQPGAPPPSDK